MDVSKITPVTGLLLVRVLKKENVEVYSKLLTTIEKPVYTTDTDDLSSVVEVIGSVDKEYKAGDMLVAYKLYKYVFPPEMLENNENYEIFAFLEHRMVFAKLEMV